jgi:non-specific serine/threonine protein kinase/serine/threonine-protein kinase
LLGDAREQLCSACLLELSVPRDAAPSPLESLLSHLTFLNVIGEGPRARAYLARFAPPDLGLVAVKRLKAGLQRIWRQSTQLGRVLQLDHPNVASVYDAGVDPEERGYCVSEYAPGLPLTRFCDRHVPSAADRAELLLQAADALQYVHAMRLSHLNLKPSNIVVLQGTSTIKVLDFEAALPCDIPGDRYRAPEQVAGGTPGPRTDVFALGVVLAELLSGVRDGGPAIGRVVTRATDHDVRARFADAQEFALALREAL